MTRTIALRQVAEGSGPGVLTVEFPGDSTGLGLAAEIGAAAADQPVWRLDPVTSLDLQPELRDYPALAAACVDDLRPRLAPAGGRFTLVGYCSAAAFARHLAGALDRAGLPPDALVLVGAAAPSTRTVWAEFVGLRRKLTGDAVDDEPPAALLGDPSEAIRWLGARLDGYARRFVAEQGFEPDEAGAAAEEITGRYRAWLWFLLQAAGTAVPQVGCPVYDLAGAAGDPTGDGEVVRFVLDRSRSASAMPTTSMGEL
jgi:hypothetical protein